MSTNQVLVLVAVGVAIAAALLWPLLRGKAALPVRGPSAASPLAVAPEVDELAELEMDRAMGRISEADYQRLRARHESASVAPPPPDEAPVAAAAAVVPGPAAPAPVASGTPDAEALVRRWRDMPRPACSRCGERPEAEARYCSNCGTALA